MDCKRILNQKYVTGIQNHKHKLIGQTLGGIGATEDNGQASQPQKLYANTVSAAKK